MIKPVFRKLGLRRHKIENLHYRLDRHFPTRFLGVWFSKPGLILRWLQNTLARRELLCLPDMPGEIGYELAKLAMILGVRLVHNAERPRFGMAWQDVTVRKDPDIVRQGAIYFLNRRCADIGKNRIEEVFESVFGYALRVDPTTHRGLCVRKSVLNAKHDGIVLNCPIAKSESGYVYQHLIDNTVNDGKIMDLRTPFYRDTLPLVYIKYRPVKTRFSDSNDRVTLARPDEIFSREEQKMIVEFARAFQLDYGGIDILRDKATGRLYIVDVNTTPFGPPKELSSREKRRALAVLAAAFHDKFIADFSALARDRAAKSETVTPSR